MVNSTPAAGGWGRRGFGECSGGHPLRGAESFTPREQNPSHPPAPPRIMSMPTSPAYIRGGRGKGVKPTCEFLLSSPATFAYSLMSRTTHNKDFTNRESGRNNARQGES